MLSTSLLSITGYQSIKIRKLLNSIDTVIIAFDGVLWCDNVLIHNVIEAIRTLKDLRKKIFYLENNETRTIEELLKKLNRLLYPITKDEILNTYQTPIEFLKNYNIEGKVYVIGGTEIKEELEKAKIPYCVSGPNSDENDSDIKAVIVESDQPLNCSKMIDVRKHLSNVRTILIGVYSSKRVLFPEVSGIPGTTTMLEYIETFTGREPVRTIKSKPDIIKAIDPNRTLVISDRVIPKSNINAMIGRQGDFKTLLVLSGVTGIEEIRKWNNSSAREDQNLIPDYYIQTLGHLYFHMTKAIGRQSRKRALHKDLTYSLTVVPNFK